MSKHTRCMTIDADELSARTGAEECLVVEEYEDAEVVRRVTIRLGRYGAEELALKVKEFLRTSEEHAVNLRRHLEVTP